MRKRFICMLLMVVLTGAGLVFVAERVRAEAAFGYVSPEEARQAVQSGQALLVCSYGDEICRSFHLEGAIFLSQLESRLPSLPKDQEIIFYCG